MAEKTVYIIDLKDKVTPKLKNVGKAAKNTDSVFTGMAGKLTGLFAGFSAIQIGRDLVQTTAKFQGLTNAIKFSSDTALQGEVSLAWLENFSGKYGLALESATEGFKMFQGAMIGTAFSSNEVRGMFESVSKGAVTMGLNAENTKGVFLALGQIMGKGKVQAEELRGQIGERVPGAFNLAARAMGMTTAELDKMMAKGELIAEDFLPKFAAEMEKTFGGGADLAAHSITSELNRLASAWDNLMKSIGNSDTNGTFGTVLGGLSSLINDLAYSFKGLEEKINLKIQPQVSKALGFEESNIKNIIAQKGSKEDIEANIKEYLKASRSGKENQLLNIQKQISGEKTRLGYDPKTNKKSGLFGDTDLNDVMGAMFDKGQFGKLEDLLKKEKLLKTLIDGVDVAGNKAIDTLYKPKLAGKGVKAPKAGKKSKGLGGISLNESRNGITSITFNIEKFQENHLGENASKSIPADVAQFTDKLRQGLLSILQDASLMSTTA